MSIDRSELSVRRLWVACLIVLLMILRATPPVWAWGPLGHRVTARLAEKHLDANAKAAVASLLEKGETLADASTWADEHRREIAGSAPWHYIDVPLDEPRYDPKFSGADARHGCIVEKLREFQTSVNDPKRTVEERRFALRFIVHLVGDLHMPLHVGDNHDRGGNDTQVRFFDKGSNMHRVWDSDLIQRAGHTEAFWLADLDAMDTAEHRTAARAGTVEDWASESLAAARLAYQVPWTGQQVRPGQKLDQVYYEANLPVARRRLYEGGVRLARVLNEAFPDPK